MTEEFTLEPDELEPDRPARRPVRLVSTGLADTVEVPPSHAKGPDHPPCYTACAACGQMVLTGETANGTRLALETHTKTYTVLWLFKRARPLLQESRAYPVHRCRTDGRGEG
jgi:hypothetical protein